MNLLVSANEFSWVGKKKTIEYFLGIGSFQNLQFHRNIFIVKVKVLGNLAEGCRTTLLLSRIIPVISIF